MRTTAPAGQISTYIEELGFPPIQSTATLKSIANFFPYKKNRCGIYLLMLPSGCFCIGKSKTVVRRFAQHLAAHEKILGFSFIPTKISRLDATERDLIFRAQALGLVLTNSTHVAHIVGETDLDLVVPPDQQERWLKENTTVSNDFNQGKIVLDESHLACFSRQYTRFMASDYHDAVVCLLRKYISSCIIAPDLTEYAFWSLSCMPSTSAGTRIAVVNAGMMELLVIGLLEGRGGPLSAFINVSEAILSKNDALVNFMISDGIGFTYPLYRDSGNDCCQVYFLVEDHDWIFKDPTFRAAAADLSLRIMRKRPTIFSKYHCKQLADEVLSGV